MTGGSLVQIATFDHPATAHIIREKLLLRTVDSRMDGEHHIAADWLMINAIGGVKLLVLDRDAVRARAIVNKSMEIPVDTEFFNSEPVTDDEVCPRCKSNSIYLERFHWKWVFISMMFSWFSLADSFQPHGLQLLRLLLGV